jgi:hypothetical protein
MVDLENWVEMHKSTSMASKNPHFKWIEALPRRMEVLLDLAYQEYPFIRALKTPIPVFCPAFLADLASCIQAQEEGFIEVSGDKCESLNLTCCFQFFTLLDPYVAHRFRKNKTHTYLPLTSMFEFYATAPNAGLTSPLDRLEGSNLKMEDYGLQIEKVWTHLFCHFA